VEQPQTINPYPYCSNNPINRRDPLGLFDNPLPNLPSFSDAFPNSNFAAPVADIVIGGIEAGAAATAGVAAGVSLLAGPEFWWITLPAAPFSLEAGIDAVDRIKGGIERLGGRFECR